MFDVEAFAVSGVSLIALVFGLTEFIKSQFDLTGKKVTVLAACLGGLIMVVYQLIPIIPAPYEQIVKIIVSSLTFGLAASGFYKYGAERLPKQS